MADSVTASAIPAGYSIVGGYEDGRYAWTAADWARFPNAAHVRIAVHPSTLRGNCLDIETGDARPEDGPTWVMKMRGLGAWPSVYCSMSIWGEVRNLFAGMAPPPYWVAAYPGGGPIVYDGSVAHQYADSGPHGENIDLSVALDYWPGVDGGGPGPAPPSTQAEDEDMHIGITSEQNLDGSHDFHLWVGDAAIRQFTGTPQPPYGIPSDAIAFSGGALLLRQFSRQETVDALARATLKTGTPVPPVDQTKIQAVHQAAEAAAAATKALADAVAALG
jgi:hypothetical protein